MSEPFSARVVDGVCRLSRPGTRFVSTGFDGGIRVADAAYNVTVPEGFDERDLRSYVDDRLEGAGLDGAPGAPALLTGVSQSHARRARHGSVEAVATAGVSNPAALPMEPTGEASDPEADAAGPGTVNVIVGTTRDLPPGALANLVAVVAEAKAATLLALAGVPGTTTDAVVVGCDPSGAPERFSGSSTEVGAATRACVREAVAASFRSRYADRSVPDGVADAEYGVVTDRRADVSTLDG